MYFEVSAVSKRQLDRMRDKLKIQAGCGKRNSDEHILAWAACAQFNQEMRDSFEIEGRDAE